MEQQIGFCTTSDGVGIAYAALGEGPPLVYVNGWPGHLALEWEASAREFLEELAQGVTLVRYDMRGSGLSDRNVRDFSLPTLLKDLEAVVDHLKLERFALISFGLLGGPLAMSYAVAHPERVNGLILSSAFLRGQEIIPPEKQKAIVSYIETFGYPLAIDADTSPEDFPKLQEIVRLQEKASSREAMAEITRAMLSADVSEIASQIPEHALILHGRHDKMMPFHLGRALALSAPQARFVPLEGNTSSPWTMRDAIFAEVRRFLGIEVAEPAPRAAPAAAGGTLATILFTDIEDSTALTQRLGDAGAQEMLRAHNAIVRDALRAHGGTEIKHTGDGIMASFPSASRALECAVAIQRDMEGSGVQDRDSDVRVRIGLNAGEPVAEGSDLFGTAVQLARRICDQADGGAILVSDVVRQLAAGKGFLFADRGTTALKGFEDPVRMYEVRWREE